MGQPLRALLLIAGLVVAIVVVCGALFVYWATGLAVGAPAQNGFLTAVLVVAAIAGGTWWCWWLSRPPKQEP